MSKVNELKNSRERVDESGKVTVTRVFHVEYAVGDPVISPLQAQIDLANSIYAVTNGVAMPDEATVFCRIIKPSFVDVCNYLITCTYKSFTSDPRERAVNDEEVEYDNSTRMVTEYYDRATEPLDDNEGKHGVQMLVPTQIVRVKRIHSTSRAGLWDDFGGHVNSDVVTTPGGVQLCDLPGGLLLLSAPARQVDTNKWQVVYTFDHDCCAFYLTGDDAAGVSLKHRIPIATIDKTTRLVTSVSLKDVYPTAALSDAMADE